MDCLYSFEQMDEAIAFQSMRGMRLSILKDGKNALWLLKKGPIYIWESDISFSFDVLECFPEIRKEMVSNQLELFFADGFFRATLSFRQKSLKKESLDTFYCASKAHSIKKALSLLNRKLLLQGSDFVRTSIGEEKNRLVPFESFKALQLIRRKEKNI